MQRAVKWFVGDVLPRLHGRAFIVRYADDAVLGVNALVNRFYALLTAYRPPAVGPLISDSILERGVPLDAGATSP